MREDIKVSEAREHQHGDRNSKTNWERIFDDVGGETVFNAIGIFLKSEDETRKTNASEIQKRHFNGLEGIAKRKNNEENSKN